MAQVDRPGAARGTFAALTVPKGTFAALGLVGSGPVVLLMHLPGAGYAARGTFAALAVL